MQLHEVAVLVQQGEGVGLHAAGDELDGQTVGGGAVDLQHVPLVQGGVKADMLPGDAVANGWVDHDTRGAELRGERHRQRPGVAHVEEVALPPLAVPVAVVADGKLEAGDEAAHDSVLALEAVPVGLGAVEHEVQPGVRVELDGVGGLLQHEAGKILVAEVGGAGGEEGQLLQKQICLPLALRPPEIRDDLMRNPLHALALHGDPLLVDALGGLEGDIHAREVVNLVGDAIVPAEVEGGPGVCHEAEMVIAHGGPPFSGSVPWRGRPPSALRAAGRRRCGPWSRCSG